MRKTIEAIQSAFGFLFAVLGGVLMLAAPKDLIAIARDYCDDLSISPPLWLNENHEHQIVRFLFEIIFVFVAIILLRPLVAHVFWLLWKKARDFTEIGQILGKIPTKIIPQDGNWSVAQERANFILRRLNERNATIKLSVRQVYPVTEGRYRGLLVLQAEPIVDKRTKLLTSLHAYFDGAVLKQIEGIRDLRASDAPVVEGTITRVDINYRPDAAAWVLNIDFNRCVWH